MRNLNLTHVHELAGLLRLITHGTNIKPEFKFLSRANVGNKF
jgi:hypothetical protein